MLRNGVYMLMGAGRNMGMSVGEDGVLLIEAGKSLKEVIALKPNADLDLTLGQGFLKPEQVLGILYDSLTN